MTLLPVTCDRLECARACTLGAAHISCCGCGWAGCGAGSERALSKPIPSCRSFLRWCFEVFLVPKALALVLAPKALVFSSPGAEGPKQFMCPSVCVSLSPSPLVSLRKMRLGRPQGQKFSKGAFGDAFSVGLRPQLTLIS